MKTIYSFILAGILIFAFSSCSHVSKEGEHDSHHAALDKLHNEVMEIHDEVMPKMGELMGYKTKAKVELDSIMALGEDQLVDRKMELMQIHAALEKADKAMMDWMHQFEPLPDSIGAEAATEYLESEKAKITEVKDIMLQALEDAHSVLTEEAGNSK